MQETLFKAIEQNDAQKIQELIASGLDVTHPEEGSFTPLMAAVFYGSGDAFETLFQNGAPLNMVGHEGKTALDVWEEFNGRNDAVQMRNIRQIMRENNARKAETQFEINRQLMTAIQKADSKKYNDLLSRGALLTFSGEEEKNPLIQAYQSGKMRFFKTVVDEATKGDLSSPVMTPLLDYFIQNNEVKGLKEFVKMGGDIHFQPKGEDSLFHKALRSGHNEMIIALLAMGADFDAPNQEGCHPIDIALNQNNGKVFLNLLQAHISREERVLNIQHFVDEAIDLGRDDVIKSLLKAEAPLVEKGDATLLLKTLKLPTKDPSYAKPRPKSMPRPSENEVIAGRENIVKQFLSYGANANQKDENGDDALHLVIQNGYASLIPVLLDNKADVNSVDKDGRRPLQLAVCYNTPKDVDLLILRGADVNATDHYGSTALMWATARSPESLRLLASNGANLNAQNQGGDTALITAADNGNWPAIKTLLELGANTEIQNKKGKDCVTVLGENLSLISDKDIKEVSAFLKAAQERKAKQNKKPFLKRFVNTVRGG